MRQLPILLLIVLTLMPVGCDRTSNVRDRMSSLLPEEAEKVQRFVNNEVLGALYNLEFEKLKNSGWKEGIKEAGRVRNDVRNLSSTGLMGTLRGNEYTVQRIAILPLRSRRCVVITAPYGETLRNPRNDLKPYAFLVEREKDAWRVKGSKFLPDTIRGTEDPERIFEVFEGYPGG